MILESDRSEIQALAFDNCKFGRLLQSFASYIYGDNYTYNHRVVMKIKTHDVVKVPRTMHGPEVPHK